MKLIIPGTLPGLNQYITALDRNRNAGSVLKKSAQSRVEWLSLIHI